MAARLIKTTGRLVPAAVLGAKAQAAAIIQQAQATLADAEQQAVTIRAQAQQAGYQDGFAAGRDAAQAAATELLASARADAEQLRLQARDAAVVLARRMAEKIVGRAVTLAPEIIADIAATALAAARARGAITLRVHPDDRAVIDQQRPHWSAALEASAQVRVVSDESVERHGCIVETPVGRLDARLSTQLEALERALRRLPDNR